VVAGEAGRQGTFTAELEQALLRGEADVAVHSSKDLPNELAGGLVIAGYLPREDPRDVLIVRRGVTVPQVIATSSPRRRLQIRLQLPDATFTEIRGNVDTRLKKISSGAADATVLAAAGLKRLGLVAWSGLDFHPLEFTAMVPAVGQGAIAVQCREEDAARFAAALDPATGRQLGLERALQGRVGGGCQLASRRMPRPACCTFFTRKPANAACRSPRRIWPAGPGRGPNSIASGMVRLTRAPRLSRLQLARES